jgi:BirA family biotin operon repressor/biotin-[acetyl-CoA-carboxylase] ligase
MGIADDLAAEVLAEQMPDRPIRSYPAVLSTEAATLPWAREGAPHGAVLVAGYQASPRGRAGLPWDLPVGHGVGFSIVLRPELHAAREGWVYAPAVCGLADAVGEGAEITWPDEVHRAGSLVGAIGAWVELGAEGVDWAVLNVLLSDITPPRAPALARAVSAIEARFDASGASVLEDYRPRCATIGRRVLARLIPMGPAGPRVEGVAVDVIADGSLVIKSDSTGNRVAVRPQNLGMLDDLAAEASQDSDNSAADQTG